MEALTDYLRAALGYEKTEQFRVLFLDGRSRLIADEIMGRGTVNHAPVYPLAWRSPGVGWNCMHRQSSSGA